MQILQLIWNQSWWFKLERLNGKMDKLLYGVTYVFTKFMGFELFGVGMCCQHGSFFLLCKLTVCWDFICMFSSDIPCSPNIRRKL
jgi:hypothetical protein